MSKKYFCKRTKDVDWSKLGLDDEIYYLTKDLNHASLVDQARFYYFYHHNDKSIKELMTLNRLLSVSYPYGRPLEQTIKIALKRQEGMSNKISDELEDKYLIRSAYFADQIANALKKHGYIRESIEEKWLERCLELIRTECYGNIFFEGNTFSNFLVKKLSPIDFDFINQRIGQWLDAFKSIEHKIRYYEEEVIFGTRQGYETYDPDAFAKVYEVFIQYLTPPQRQFAEWWSNKPANWAILTENELDTCRCCFANFVLNAEEIKQQIDELI